jgi:hypothetical protein
VPFERFPELKEKIEKRQRWRKIDETWSFFETQWKPKSWDDSYRFIFTRQKNKVQKKGPLQLDFFEPRDHAYDYKVIVTNKRVLAKTAVLFHNGRGSQEAVFGAAKTDAALGVVACRRLYANQIYTLSASLSR